MAVGRIIVLSVLITQTLSAPSGCIESCNFYQTSYQSHRASGGYQDHAGLIEGSTHLNDHDYAKPGNWTEHNQFDTEGGHGKVHEERGQYVEGSKRVRYYKKNYTSSYGNINGLDATELGDLSAQRRYDSVRIPSSQHLDSQSTYGQSGQTVKETGYNTMHSQQTQSSSSSSTKIDSKSERLEDLGDYSGHSQVNQQHVPTNVNTQTIDTQHHIETTPENWSRVDSYRTDGGHGRVFEEEGQYVTGPKKVRYYKKNYTSSYSTSGVPQTNIGSTKLSELHNELQRNVQRELNNLRREFHESSSSGHTASSISSMDLSQETVGFHNNDLQTAESDTYRQQLGYRPSVGTVRHYTDQQQHRETYTDTRQPLTHTYPSSTYDTDNQRTYQSHQTYTSQARPVSTHYALVPNYIQYPARSDYHQTSLQNAHSSSNHRHDEIQRTEVSDSHQQSGVAQNQLLTDTTQEVYNPSYGTYPSRHDESRHYEEHWSSSSHSGGHIAPERPADYVHGSTEHAGRTHYDRDAYNEHRDRHHTAQGYNSHAAHASESSYNSAFRTSSGKHVTGSLDLSHVAPGAADCTEETQQYQQQTRYHRKYKRDDHHVQQHQTAEDQMLSQIADDQLEDLTQQTQGSDDLTQQTSGKLEFGQQLEDLTQQTEGQLEFGQQTVGNQHLEDLTQQNEQFTQQTQGSHDDLTQQTQGSHDDLTQQSGKLEFGQQTVDGQQLKDLTQQTQGQLEFGQQTQGSHDDLTQQTNGKLEFGQQTDSQQFEDLTQQTQGQLEFGQQTVGNQHLEDLTQQSEQFTQQTQGSHDDLTQQTSGKLEFGQQTVDGQQLKDLTQQTQGQLEFEQQTQGSHDDLTQQTNGKLEFGQQTDSQQFEDLTQQTQGQLEFGQQTVGNQHLEDLTQQSEQFTQQTQGSHDDLTQQTSGKLEFGQQTDSQQFEDLTQQTQGQLEFGQQTVGNQHLEDLTQQSEQFTQQTQGSHDDFTQQTSSKLEFGQQTDSQQFEDLTQQTQGQLEFGQQTVDNPHLEDLTQQSEQFTQQTQGSHDDLMQQTSGKLEFGQQTIDNHQLEDFTQQTEGQMEFGQQTDDQQLEKLLQHTEKLEQRTPRSNSLAQQTVDKIEIGHHSNQHLEDLTQQNEQFAEQMQGSNYFTQHTSGKLTFGQTIGGHQSEDLTQNSDEQSTQQTEGQLEFGQHSVGNQHLEDLTQKNEHFADDFTQQTMGHVQFGRPEVEDLTQQENEDLTQQTGGFDDFTHQTSGRLEQQQEQQRKPSWSEYNTQHMGQFSQQTDWNANILPHQRPSHTNNKPSDQWQLEQMSQQTNFDRDFTQQTDHQSASKPAPKPKPKQRYYQHAYIPSEKDTNIDNTYKPIEVHSEPDMDNPERISSTSDYPRSQVAYSQSPGSSVYNNGEENLDRLHWIHKSNDASVGLQWHYTYHPSDLINVEGTYYGPNINPTSQQTQETQHQSRRFDFSQQETQNKHVFEQNQQLGSSQQIETSHSKNQFNQNFEEIPAKVIPLQNSQQTTELDKQRMQGQTEEPQIEPRILQAFGGGPYDPSHTDDIYNRVTINPSATLPPIYSDDPWDIREKPRETIPWIVAHKMSTENTPKPIDTTTPAVETTTPLTETTTASFWNRLGKRITTTYGKAKERAKEIFG